MLSYPFPLHKLFAVLDHGMKLLDLAFGHSIPGQIAQLEARYDLQ
jgi:hypothetical protein